MLRRRRHTWTGCRSDQCGKAAGNELLYLSVWKRRDGSLPVHEMCTARRVRALHSLEHLREYPGCALDLIVRIYVDDVQGALNDKLTNHPAIIVLAATNFGDIACDAQV